VLDGTKAFIHAVMGNFSRKILAWTIGARQRSVLRRERRHRFRH
jgi:hypothetical protein